MTEPVTFHPKELNEVSGGTKEEMNQNFEMHTKTKSGIELRFAYGKSVLEVSFRANASFETLWQATSLDVLASIREASTLRVGIRQNSSIPNYVQYQAF